MSLAVSSRRIVENQNGICCVMALSDRIIYTSYIRGPWFDSYYVNGSDPEKLFSSGQRIQIVRQEPTDTSKQPIRTHYLGHVTGYQPISDHYFLIRSRTVDVRIKWGMAPPYSDSGSGEHEGATYCSHQETTEPGFFSPNRTEPNLKNFLPYRTEPNFGYRTEPNHTKLFLFKYFSKKSWRAPIKLKKPDFWPFFDQKIRWFGQNFPPNRTEPNRRKNTEPPNRTEPNRIFGRFLEEERAIKRSLLRCIPRCIYSIFSSPLPALPQVYTTAFDKTKLIRFDSYYVNGSDPEKLFSSGQRIQIVRQEPTDTSKQPIRTHYLGHVTGYQPISHVTGYQPISDHYFLIRSVSEEGGII
eukprot:sb/3466122/